MLKCGILFGIFISVIKLWPNHLLYPLALEIAKQTISVFAVYVLEYKPEVYTFRVWSRAWFSVIHHFIDQGTSRISRLALALVTVAMIRFLDKEVHFLLRWRRVGVHQCFLVELSCPFQDVKLLFTHCLKIIFICAYNSRLTSALLVN